MGGTVSWHAQIAIGLTRNQPFLIIVSLGGLHMSGTAQCGKKSISIETVTAIEIVDDPCNTYKHNHPNTNVMQLGISR